MLQDLATARRIEADGRLVHQEEGWFVQERSREFDAAAPVAAAQGARRRIGPLAEVEPRKLRVDPSVCIAARQSVKACEEIEVAPDAQLEIERRLLKDDAKLRERRGGVPTHVAPADMNLSPVGDEKSAQDLEEGRLPRAVRSVKRHELPGGDREVDVVQRLHRPVGLDDAGKVQRLHRIHVIEPRTCLASPARADLRCRTRSPLGGWESKYTSTVPGIVRTPAHKRRPKGFVSMPLTTI